MARLIAHFIQKEGAHGAKAAVHPRSSLLPVSAEAENLVEQIRQAVAKGNPLSGRFTDPAGEKPPLQQRLLRYLRTANDPEFLSLTLDAVNLLAGEIAKEPFATGGYAVFAEYDHAGEDFILVALVSTRRRVTFDEDINLVTAITLDLEHLRHAGRIRNSGVAGNQDGVIHFVAKASEGLYFKSFLGCEPIIDPSVQGNYLHTALRGWANTEGLDGSAREAVMQKTFTYWSECRKAGKPMTLTALANILAPDAPEALLQHLAKEDTKLAGEFSAPPPSVMRRFVKFAFDQGGLKIEFDRNQWLDNLSVNGNTVTIKHAPAELVERLTEEKHGGN